ncbi:N-acetylglucosamine kinase [Paraburkholderia silvatlantica]|uniref:N-acetylglucosamine kinase n=1 Tax=Paraburkholderia silvatlantica TaxID=321895 RepID=A0A2V4TK75_9BURK|nr:ROK family protein [Paraburkholderia silvatlantica]PYE24251.1 N-acetylglucosamine kinase [Paraburkholderia silvatlantica]
MPDTSVEQGLHPRVFVADIGGSYIRLGVSDSPGSVRLVESVPTPVDSWEAFGATLEALADRHIGETGSPLVISMAGAIDPSSGVICASNVPCVSGRVLGAELSSRLRRRIRIANDADCLALAEAVEGAGAGHDVVFCVVLGSGVGGGLVVGGRVAGGASGIAGEWGHGLLVSTSVDFDGTGHAQPVSALRCGCGRLGCVDTIGGARGLERLNTLLNGEQKDSHALLDDWQQGGERARRTVSAWLALVSEPLAAVINITGASVVPVCGGLANVAPLIDALDAAVRKRTLREFRERVVVPGAFRREGGLVGAAIIARQDGAREP